MEGNKTQLGLSINVYVPCGVSGTDAILGKVQSISSVLGEEIKDT